MRGAMDADAAWLQTSSEGDRLVVTAGGPWTVREATSLDEKLQALEVDGARSVLLDMSQVTALDTAGAWLMYRTRRDLSGGGVAAELSGVAEDFQPLIRVIDTAQRREEHPVTVTVNYWLAMLNRVGRVTVECAAEGKELLNFFGSTIFAFADILRHPRKLRIVSLINQVEQTGLNAIPIVCLLSFLIGIVIAFVGADQLRRFGAEIFTVNLLGVIVLREIGVLLAAILVAGRSGSAFTAQIGTMQVNEEVDAMRTLGLQPMEVLVMPRINGLLISLPILVFLSDIAGLVGGALMATATLDLSVSQFVRQLETVLTLSHFFVGMVKAPVFAYIIAIVGCYEGLRVTGSAESVGRMTTKSVVTSIFLVIIANAIFSVIFSILRV